MAIAEENKATALENIKSWIRSDTQFPNQVFRTPHAVVSFFDFVVLGAANFLPLAKVLLAAEGASVCCLASLGSGIPEWDWKPFQIFIDQDTSDDDFERAIREADARCGIWDMARLCAASDVGGWAINSEPPEYAAIAFQDAALAERCDTFLQGMKWGGEPLQKSGPRSHRIYEIRTLPVPQMEVLWANYGSKGELPSKLEDSSDDDLPPPISPESESVLIAEPAFEAGAKAVIDVFVGSWKARLGPSLLTRSTKWGLIWRADFWRPEQEKPGRFVLWQAREDNPIQVHVQREHDEPLISELDATGE